MRNRYVIGAVMAIVLLVGACILFWSQKSEAATTTLRFTSEADAKVDSSLPDKNYGTLDRMQLDSSPAVNAYIRFNVSGLPAGSNVSAVKLRLYALTTQASGAEVYSTSGNLNWIESGASGATWNAGAPAIGSSLGRTGAISTANQYYDVTLPASAISGNGVVTFALKTASTTALSIATKENANSDAKPTLEIVATTPTVNTTTFTATMDATVQKSNPNTNYGSSTKLNADTQDVNGNPVESFVRFNLTGLSGVFSSAVLKLEPTSVSSAGTLDVYATNNPNWVETGTGGISWSNAPTMVATKTCSTSKITTANQYYTCDISSLITALSGNQGDMTLGIRSSNSTNVAIASKESTTPSAAPVIEVTTSSDTAPVLVTNAASGINENGATLNGQVNPSDSATTYWFEYGETTSYGTVTSSQTLNASTDYSPVTAALDLVLVPNTTYHYRIAASNTAGTSYGEDQAFVTSPATTHILAAAGDIACDPANGGYNSGNGTATACKQKATSDLIYNDSSIEKVLTLGDNQYECGGRLAYEQSYEGSWGRFKSKTWPATGNHEYATSKQAPTPNTGCVGKAQNSLTADSADTSLTIGAEDWKVFPSANNFTIQIDNEKMTVIAGAGTSNWTVTRGVSGTAVEAHNSGAGVQNIDGTGAVGYYSYFGAAASPLNNNCTDHCKGYYSYNLGNWHVIVVNSTCSSTNGTTTNSCKVGGTQYNWLLNDLAAVKDSQGILAVWHHPRYSSGEHGDANGSGAVLSGFLGQNPDIRDIWKLLYDNHADLVLNGHDHNYERFDKLGRSATNEMATYAIDTAVEATQTTFTLTSSPVMTTPFYARIENETVRVDSVSDNTWTVTRGVSGTASADHAGATNVYPMEQPNVDQANGIRQIIVGTGGRNVRSSTANSYDRNGAIGTTIGKEGSLALNGESGNFGILKLALSGTSYTWQFVPTPGATFTDSGSDTIYQ